MKKEKYNSLLVSANYRSIVWMTLAGVMLLSNVMLAYFVVNANTTEKTIITPPQVTKAFSVQGDNLEAPYIEQMSDYFLQKIMTYQKQTIESNLELVLSYMHPSIHGQMRTNFDLEIDKVKRLNIASVFYRTGVHVKQHSAYVTGNLVAFIGSERLPAKLKTYEMKFNYSGGNLTIVGFKEVTQDSVGNYVAVENPDSILVDAEEVKRMALDRVENREN